MPKIYAATFASNVAYSEPRTHRHSHSEKPMPDPLLLPSIALPQPTPLYFPKQQFHIGDWVYWRHYLMDFGHIIGVCWATESNVQAIGFHYLVLLDKNSPSKKLGIDSDFAFQDDLALMLSPRPKA